MIVFGFLDQPFWSTISVASILAGLPIFYAGQHFARRRTAVTPGDRL